MKLEGNYFIVICKSKVIANQSCWDVYCTKSQKHQKSDPRKTVAVNLLYCVKSACELKDHAYMGKLPPLEEVYLH